VFRPERFIDDDGKVNLSIAQRVIPFGAGTTMEQNNGREYNIEDNFQQCKMGIIFRTESLSW
jgi:hypothetical protein